MLDTGSDARMTAILGLPVGWLWGFGFLFILLLVCVFFFLFPPKKKKITAISSKWEKDVSYFFLLSVLVLLFKIFSSPFLLKYNHNH